MKTYIKLTEQYGRGVYASKSLTEGEVVEIAEVLLLDSHDTFTINRMTKLKDYTFTVNEYNGIEILNEDCLVLGNGELYNHSDNPNVKYELINLNGRKQMYFTALRDIKPDEQLFIDYNADVTNKVNVGVDNYTNNLY